MHYNAQTADVGGTEVFILLGRGSVELAYYAMVQFAFSEPNPPFLVKLETHQSDIAFTVPSAIGASLGAFRGRVANNALTGTFSNGVKVMLRKGKSYWQ